MWKSFEKNKIGICLMINSSICVCFGQLFWKLSSNGEIKNIIVGFILYGLGAIIMIIAYKFGSLSVLQPMLSINYVITIFLGKFILGESINIYKILGVSIIFISVIFIGGGDD